MGTATSTFGYENSGNLRLLNSDDENSGEDIKAFQTYIQRHNKNYLTKEEHQARLKIFAANLALVKSHDSTATGFKLGINQFADMSPEEYHKMLGFKENSADEKFLGDDEIFDDDEESSDTIVPSEGNTT